jgi:hypothetical protein
MYVFGKALEAGVLVEIYGESGTGLILARDHEHVHLWKVLLGGVVHCVHSSKLRRLQ